MVLHKCIYFIIWICLLDWNEGKVTVLLDGTDITTLTANSTVKVIEGEDTILDCFCDISDSHFIWKRDNNIISKNARLEISRTRVDDEGRYTCIVSYTDYTTDTTMEEDKSVFVETLNPPSYPVVDIPSSVLQGEELTLKCDVEANPEPTYQWRRDRDIGPLLSRDKVYNLTVESSHAIYFNVQNRMIPTIGVSKAGYISRKLYINVHTKASIINIYPGRYVDKNEGEDLLLRCTVNGAPDPKVWWSKTGDNSFYWLGGRFLSYNIHTSFAGDYVCNAENTVVAANKTTYYIHTTEVIHVRVHGDINSSSQDEMQCSKCLEMCSKETSTSLESTSFRNSVNHSMDSLMNPSSSSNSVSFKCSSEETLASLDDNEADMEHKKTLIGLGVAAGTGWIVSVLLVLLNIYIYFNKAENLRSREMCRSEFVHESPNPNNRQDQTEVESAYVSNVRLTDNTYTDLTTYDQINFSPNNPDILRDTDSTSTDTSAVTYLEPTPNSAHF